MSEPSLVTVVIPTWNRRDLLQAAIASVTAQTYPHWELIVVDDGSSDGTVEWLQAQCERRLKLLALPHAGNPGRLRNIGAAAGSGEWLAFLDSDDVWLPQKLELQLQALRLAGKQWCYTNCSLMDINGAPIPMRGGEFRPLSGWIADDLLAERTGAFIGTLLIRRQLFKSVGGFDEELHFLEDLDLEIRLAHAAEALALPDTLVTVRDHLARRTTQADRLHEHSAHFYAEILKRTAQSESRRLARRNRAYHLAEAGAQRLARRELWQGTTLLARALALGDRPAHWLRAAARGLRRGLSLR